MNPTSLMYWFPKVALLDIPVPETICRPVDAMQILGAMEGESPLSQELTDSIYTAADEIGYPLFLRTDLQSGKHGWKNTCYVSSCEVLIKNMFGVAEENELGACFMGPPYTHLVFRQFLELETAFIAFYGDMPINRERRYFIRDGEILCHHPYWPEEAIEEHSDDPKWREKLSVLNAEPESEVALLSDYALRVGRELPSFWSVDFAKAKDGKWYLIDMAEGQNSYHWPGCPNDPY